MKSFTILCFGLAILAAAEANNPEAAAAAARARAAAAQQHPRQQQVPPQHRQQQHHQPPPQHHQQQPGAPRLPRHPANPPPHPQQQQQQSVSPPSQQPLNPEVAKAESASDIEAEEDLSDWKEEPCNFNFYYACAAQQLWGFHRSFRAYMAVQGRKEETPERKQLYLRDLQTQYCRMMDTNANCASRLTEHGCSKPEVDWFKQQTVDFTSDSLGGGEAAWNFQPGQCPWVRGE